MAPTRADLLAAADNFIQEYNKWTAESIISFRSPTCVHRVGPTSLNFPDRNNAVMAIYSQQILDSLPTFTLRVVNEDETFVDVEKRKVFSHMTATSESNFGPFFNEFIFILTVNEDGKSLDFVYKFMNSTIVEQWVRKINIKKDLGSEAV